MKLPRRVYPEKACSEDMSRPALTVPFLDVENGRIEASDSYVAVRIPVKVKKGDTSGPLPLRALKVAREEQHELTCDGDVAVRGVATFTRPPLTNTITPSLDKVFSAFDGAETIKVGINAAYLLRVAEALGVSSGEPIVLELRVTEDGPQVEQAMRVTTVGGDGEAVLMPIRVRR